MKDESSVGAGGTTMTYVSAPPLGMKGERLLDVDNNDERSRARREDRQKQQTVEAGNKECLTW